MRIGFVIAQFLIFSFLIVSCTKSQTPNIDQAQNFADQYMKAIEKMLKKDKSFDDFTNYQRLGINIPEGYEVIDASENHVAIQGKMGVFCISYATDFPEERKMTLKEKEPPMALVEGGTFIMGGVKSRLDFSVPRYEKKEHTVEVHNFYISRSEIAQLRYQSIMDANPSKNKFPTHPVSYVSWYDAIEYCNKLSLSNGYDPYYTINGLEVKINFDSKGYRLPTEAEWEYAARGGVNWKEFDFLYSGSNDCDEVAWYDTNYKTNEPSIIGKKAPNKLGIYDMSGNVWEWCWDWYSDTYYEESPKNNPMGPNSGKSKVIRGGSFSSDKTTTGDPIWSLLTIYRNYALPTDFKTDIGFRIVRTADDSDETKSALTQMKLERENREAEKNRQKKAISKNINDSMILIKGGIFQLDENSVDKRDPNIDRTENKVAVVNYFICKTEVTQDQYFFITNKNPSEFKGKNNPVENIKWVDAIEFCNLLSETEGLEKCYIGSGSTYECNFQANGFRLPTEIEWAYAAIGGNLSKRYKYSGSDSLDDVAWY